MRPSKIFTLSLIALLLAITTLPAFVDAKRGGGGRSSRSSSRSRGGGGSGNIWRRSSYGGSFYTGVVIIPNASGYYYEGYGNQCPNGCAVDGRCGNYEECRTSFNWWLLIGIVSCVGCCLIFGKKKEPEKDKNSSNSRKSDDYVPNAVN